MSTDLTRRAIAEACRRADEAIGNNNYNRPHVYAAIEARPEEFPLICLLAGLIEKYEPPVNPLLEEARKIAAEAMRGTRAVMYARWVENGGSDDAPAVQAALAALRSRENRA